MSKRNGAKKGCKPFEAMLNRREFLANGVKGYSMGVLSPLVLSLLQHTDALAETSVMDSAAIILHLPGGAAGSRHGGIPVTQEGSDTSKVVPSSIWTRHYSVPSLMTAQSFGGIPYFYKDTSNITHNRFIEGALGVIDADSDAVTIKTKFFASLCPTITNNDSSPAFPGPVGLITTMLRLKGIKAKGADVNGNRNTSSGNQTGEVMYNKLQTRVTSSNVKEQLAIGAFCKSLASAGATETNMGQFVTALRELTEFKLGKVGTGNLAKAFEEIHLASVNSLPDKVVTPPDMTESVLNPGNASTAVRRSLTIPDATTGAVFSTSNDELDIIRTQIFLALQGIFPVASIAVPRGFDYHDQMRTNSGAADFMAGQIVGMIIRTAYNLGKNVFIWIGSDGSVSSTNSTYDGTTPGNAVVLWDGDNSGYGVATMIAVNGNSAKPITHAKKYVGFTSATTGRITPGTYLGSVGMEASAIGAWQYAILNGLTTVYPEAMRLAGFPTTVINAIMSTRSLFT